MIKSKEEILTKITEANDKDSWSLSYGMDFFDGKATTVLNAMEIYAQQEAIKFYEFFAKTSVSNPDKLWKIYQDNVQSKQK